MKHIHLSKLSASAPDKLGKKPTEEHTDKLIKKLQQLQYLLYAEHKHSLLVILQGLDASGKDGAIRNVFGKLNPQGVSVSSFKVPTQEELSHDFLWRIHLQTPARGMIRIFNRSHYEDVLVTRVHGLIDDQTAQERMRAINDFERLLAQNNTHVLKFFLHVSPKEQMKRLKERIEDPKKQWKYNANDLKERSKWETYIKYYEEVFENCGPENPWKIVPTDQNWYKEYLIAKTVCETLGKLKMKYPTLQNTA